MNGELLSLIGISGAQLQRLVSKHSAEAQRREQRLRRGLPALSTHGRIVILVDDGLATGATMRAAVRAVRGRGAAKLVVAVPVGAAETCERVAAEVDELVCPHPLDEFYAVGIHYQNFGQTSDEEVERILSDQRAARALGEQAKGAH
jgi:predicted phosphoribosyltransferase